VKYQSAAIISDLHLDFWEKWYRHKQGDNSARALGHRVLDKCLNKHAVDLVIVAGDWGNGVSSGPFSATQPQVIYSAEGPDIIWVPGNHDYYGYDLPTSPLYVHDDQFVATTLWTNFDGAVGYEERIYGGISDAYAIKGTSAYKVQNLSEQSFKIIQELNKEIVVTHFPPSHQSVDLTRFRGDPYNPYFVNNRDAEVERLNTKLWVCGHVHHRHNYKIGDCLVIANPLAYPGEVDRSIDNYEPVFVQRTPEGHWKIAGQS